MCNLALIHCALNFTTARRHAPLAAAFLHLMPCFFFLLLCGQVDITRAIDSLVSLVSTRLLFPYSWLAWHCQLAPSTWQMPLKDPQAHGMHFGRCCAMCCNFQDSCQQCKKKFFLVIELHHPKNICSSIEHLRSQKQCCTVAMGRK